MALEKSNFVVATFTSPKRAWKFARKKMESLKRPELCPHQNPSHHVYVARKIHFRTVCPLKGFPRIFQPFPSPWHWTESFPFFLYPLARITLYNLIRINSSDFVINLGFNLFVDKFFTGRKCSDRFKDTLNPIKRLIKHNFLKENWGKFELANRGKIFFHFILFGDSKSN